MIVMNPKSARRAWTGSSEVMRMFACGSTSDGWTKQMSLGSLPYTFEVPVSEIYVVKIFYSLCAVDEL